MTEARSEKLTKAEHKAFIKWVNGFRTKQEAADIIEIARPNIYRVMGLGSGKPTTIKAIRKQLA